MIRPSGVVIWRSFFVITFGIVMYSVADTLEKGDAWSFAAFLAVWPAVIICRQFVLGLPIGLRGETLDVEQKARRLTALVVSLVFWVMGTLVLIGMM